MGLEDLASVIRELNIPSIAIPPLGCGLGGLKWEDVKAAMERIFAPQMNAMNKHYCHVMLETSVAVEPLTYRKKKPFSKKEEWLPTPYFMLHLPQNIADAYHDGDMVYAVGALEIPITRAMLAQGTVYVMSGSVKPVVKSNNPGLALH